MLARPTPMKGVERINTVIVYPNQQAGFTSCNPHVMDVDRGRNYYSCKEFGYLAQNCRRQIMGQGKRMEYKNNQNNEQSNLNGKGDLIVLN